MSVVSITAITAISTASFVQMLAVPHTGGMI